MFEKSRLLIGLKDSEDLVLRNRRAARIDDIITYHDDNELKWGLEQQETALDLLLKLTISSISTASSTQLSELPPLDPRSPISPSSLSE